MLYLLPFLATLASASIIPTSLDILQAADRFLHPSSPLLEIHPNYYDEVSGKHRKLCVLSARDDKQFDDDNFLKAHEECGKGGIIRLPDANYTIGNPITTHLEDATLDVHGWISFSTDIDNWVAKRVPFEFQDLALAWIITGNNYVLDGNDKGGIFGNGDAWYNWAKHIGNKYGRPMSFAVTNSTNVTVKNWSVIQPQFWASIIINSTNVLYKDYYVNATQHNPEALDIPLNWLQNTDGCDTFRSHNVTFENMVYQGGDDCIALKPNSSMITARNITCIGGTGIAFGSIGQYKGVPDYIQDVYMEDIKVSNGQHEAQQGVYFKSWQGISLGTPPNGGGGGTGYARNITVKNIEVHNVTRPVFLHSDLTYLLDHQGDAHNTGLFHWHDIHIQNMTGTSSRNRVIWLDCSRKTPCYDITFEDFNVTAGKDDLPRIHHVCNNVAMDPEDGLQQCHANGDKEEGWWSL